LKARTFQEQTFIVVLVGELSARDRAEKEAGGLLVVLVGVVAASGSIENETGGQLQASDMSELC
jgi:hypothetical protein